MKKLIVMILAAMMLLSLASVAAAAPQDTWKIVSPAGGTNVIGSEVTITLDPGEIKVAKPGAVVAGEGHWHFLLDGKEVGKGPVNEFTFKALTPGKHLLKVELHQGDHSPYPGDTGREITVNVALPNTGAGLGWLAAAGLALLGAAWWMRSGKRAEA